MPTNIYYFFNINFFGLFLFTTSWQVGDADYNNEMELTDFSQWKKEFIENSLQTIADFTNDSFIDFKDFSQ